MQEPETQGQATTAAESQSEDEEQKKVRVTTINVQTVQLAACMPSLHMPRSCACDVQHRNAVTRSHWWRLLSTALQLAICIVHTSTPLHHEAQVALKKSKQKKKKKWYDPEPLDPPPPAAIAGKRPPAERAEGVSDCSGRDLTAISGTPPCQDVAPAPGEENQSAKVRARTVQATRKHAENMQTTYMS